MRAKDSDRNETCQILDTALAEGQLSMAEHGERVKAATTASTLSQLQDLVADIQTGKTLDVPMVTKVINRRPAGPGWGIKAAIATVLVLLGVAIGWGLYGNTTSPLSFESDPGAKSDGIPARVLTPPRQLLSLGGFNGLFEQMRKKFGDTMGYEMDIRADWASMYRTDPNDQRRKTQYDYRGGWGDPDSSADPLSEGDRLVDLAKFDFDAIVGIMRGAPETLDVPRADVTNSWLEINPSKDPVNPDAVDITIYVSSDFASGHMTVAADGTPKEIYPATR